MMKSTISFILISTIFLLLSGCGGEGRESMPDTEQTFERDLEAIKKHGKLTAITNYSPTSYFLYRGEPMGYEYELLEHFASYLDVELEILVTNDVDSLIDKLNNGEADLIAFGLTITQNRKQEVAFTDYLYLTHQVLVQRKPENWRNLRWSEIEKSKVKDAIELIGDTVSVRRNSSYFERLQNLSDEIGGEILIDTLPGHLTTDEIIKMVVDGEIKFTVADNNLAAINASYYPSLNVEVPISFSQRVAWATRFDSPDLLKAANEWITEMKKKVDYYVIYNKYFENKRKFRARVKSEFYSKNEQKISPYDELIKSNARRIGWDWRLVASLIYQESQFKPSAFSWAEASGLMQLMPETAEELGVTDRSDPAQSIRGGTDYLLQLWNRIENVSDSLERVKFTLAAYNCGLGHLYDAQRLAEKRGLNPSIWDDNVSDMMLALSYPKGFNDEVVRHGYVRGIEPYTYVEQIFDRYQHYMQFFKDQSEIETVNDSSKVSAQ